MGEMIFEMIQWLGLEEQWEKIEKQEKTEQQTNKEDEDDMEKETRMGQPGS